MNEAIVAIDAVAATTISLAPIYVADIVIDDGQADVLATASLAAIRTQPATIIALATAPAAVVEIAAIYQPPPPVLANPQFSYESGQLARIDYDGSYAKIFGYVDGRLATLDFTNGARTLRKSFVYDAAGVLIGISES